MSGLFGHCKKHLLQISEPLTRQSRAGRSYTIRPLKPADQSLLAAFLGKLTSETISRRYFVGRISLSETAVTTEIDRLYRLSKTNGSIMVAISSLEDDAVGKEEIVGVGEMIPLPNLYLTAELGIIVRDDWQGEGIGSDLSQQLIHEARKKGMRTLQAETFTYNRAVLHIWSRLGLSYSFQTSQSFTIMLALLACTDYS